MPLNWETSNFEMTVLEGFYELSKFLETSTRHMNEKLEYQFSEPSVIGAPRNRLSKKGPELLHGVFVALHIWKRHPINLTICHFFHFTVGQGRLAMNGGALSVFLSIPCFILIIGKNPKTFDKKFLTKSYWEWGDIKNIMIFIKLAKPWFFVWEIL